MSVLWFPIANDCCSVPDAFLSLLAAGRDLTGHELPAWIVEITRHGAQVSKRTTSGDISLIGALKHMENQLAIERG